MFAKVMEDTNVIWWPSGRTVLNLKRKDLSDKKSYCPITCLNNSLKPLTGILTKYMRSHAMQNSICDEGQMKAMDGALGKVRRENESSELLLWYFMTATMYVKK